MNWIHATVRDEHHRLTAIEIGGEEHCVEACAYLRMPVIYGQCIYRGRSVE